MKNTNEPQEQPLSLAPVISCAILNREIKFRGKTIPFKEGKYVYNGEWVHGYFHKTYKGECYIIRFSETGIVLPGVKVDPASVSQFTGFKSKTGDDIYEGDIIERLYKYEVRFEHGAFCGRASKNGYLTAREISSDMNIVGNVFDQPEFRVIAA